VLEFDDRIRKLAFAAPFLLPLREKDRMRVNAG